MIVTYHAPLTAVKPSSPAIYTPFSEGLAFRDGHRQLSLLDLFLTESWEKRWSSLNFLGKQLDLMA
jgi:hypothetical protein